MGLFDSSSEYVTSGDWWAVWFGLLTLTVVVVASLCGLGSSHVSPEKWTQSPFQQEHSTWVGFSVLALSSVALGSVAMAFMLTAAARKAAGPSRGVVRFRELALGLAVLVALCVGAVCLGKQADLRTYGLTEVAYGIVLGLVFKTALNQLAHKTQVRGAEWLQDVTKSVANGEFYIKVGIVLLALEVGVVGDLGLPGILSSWPVVVVVIFLMYHIGVRVFKMKDQRVVLVLAAGTAVCGASAATAVQAAIGAGKDDLAAVITVLSLFTILQMVGLPFAIREMGLANKVAGAWIGGSIDATGAVVGAAEILDNETITTTAATLKVVQNAAIGFVVLGITSLWRPAGDEETGAGEPVDAESPVSDAKGVGPGQDPIRSSLDEAAAGDTIEEDEEGTEAKKMTSAELRMGLCLAAVRGQALILWKRFPKFVVGFFLMSALISILKLVLQEGDFSWIQTRLKEASQWWFALGFTALGVDLDPLYLVKAVSRSPLVPLYLVGQALDLGLTLAASYLAFR